MEWFYLYIIFFIYISYRIYTNINKYINIYLHIAHTHILCKIHFSMRLVAINPCPALNFTENKSKLNVFNMSDLMTVSTVYTQPNMDSIHLWETWQSILRYPQIIWLCFKVQCASIKTRNLYLLYEPVICVFSQIWSIMYGIRKRSSWTVFSIIFFIYMLQYNALSVHQGALKYRSTGSVLSRLPTTNNLRTNYTWSTNL